MRPTGPASSPDPEALENFAMAQTKRLIRREDRNFVEVVDGTFGLPSTFGNSRVTPHQPPSARRRSPIVAMHGPPSGWQGVAIGDSWVRTHSQRPSRFA